MMDKPVALVRAGWLGPRVWRFSDLGTALAAVLAIGASGEPVDLYSAWELNARGQWVPVR